MRRRNSQMYPSAAVAATPMSSPYRRPTWDTVMLEIEKRALVREQRAYLSEVIDADRAYVARHGLTDSNSLQMQAATAVRSGVLRPCQVPSSVDGGAGLVAGNRVGGPPTSPARGRIGVAGYLLEHGTDDEKNNLLRIELETFTPPPLEEVEELLTSLETDQTRLDYLRGLRDRMDRFEAAADRSPDRAMLLGEPYLRLVELVRREALSRSPSWMRRGGQAIPQRQAGDSRHRRQDTIETPLPEPEDDGTRLVYKAISDYPARGIQRGRRYSLWPGDVLVRSGVVIPLAPPELPSDVPPSGDDGSPPPAFTPPPVSGLPGYIAETHASRLRKAFRRNPPRIRGQGKGAFKTLRDWAGVSEAEERTVKRALNYKAADGFSGFIDALFAAVGETPPNDGGMTAEDS